jgi:hypothetical protein
VSCSPAWFCAEVFAGQVSLASLGRGAQPATSAPAKIIVAADGSVAAERIDHLDYHQAPPRGVMAGAGRAGPGAGVGVPGSSGAAGAGGLGAVYGRHRGADPGAVRRRGVGKSQLAASYARGALAAGTELVVWADASTEGTVIEVLARAAARVQASGVSGDDAEVDVPG